MKASSGREVPAGGEWVYEVKHDGVRVIAHATAVYLGIRDDKDARDVGLEETRVQRPRANAPAGAPHPRHRAPVDAQLTAP